MENKVALELTRAEALVLYDWIVRFNKAEQAEFEDQAEQRVLWDIQAMLESSLVEPLGPCYADHLAAARAEVRDRTD